MIATGRFHELHVLRRTQVGAFLGNAQGDEVLLPWAHCPADLDRHEVLRVFVYRDSQDRQVATTQEPLITLHGFACLRVKEIASIGAFLDWGLDKDLLVPFREQPKPMRAGQQWVVYLDLDKRSDRLFASAKIDHRLRPAPPELEGTEQVDVLVYEARELGWSVIVNDRYKGLIYANETFKPVRVGEVLTGYVRAVREDGKLDISLEPLGYDRSIDEHVRVLTERLQANDGTLPFT
ncbi:MAG: GntR family transcriptional regulator, partial [Flavobacteriales bacterium]|nr:GntR family transcriptional regulator [Flavobacteriales bacterium]